MGILDEAIREHLELKRQHGADESELQGLENEAFGPADRPDAAGPTPGSEDETQIISPGSSLTAPAGEGDQLDKVFEHTRQAEADQAAKAAAEEETQIVREPSAEQPVEIESEFDVTEAVTVESPEAKPVEPEPEPEPVPEPEAEIEVEEEGDASEMLEAERQHLASHPTEHYDVDAAIAEEDEIDVLSESSLSDELDRALDSGEVESSGQHVEYQPEAEPESAEHLEESDSGEIEVEEDSAEFELEEEDSEDDAEELYEDAATENQPVGGDKGSGDFFDQDDVLEATPDFLEETPEHDELWFEQKEPKDFDFGD